MSGRKRPRQNQLDSFRTPTCDRHRHRHRRTQGHGIYRASIESRDKKSHSKAKFEPRSISEDEAGHRLLFSAR